MAGIWPLSPKAGGMAHSPPQLSPPDETDYRPGPLSSSTFRTAVNARPNAPGAPFGPQPSPPADLSAPSASASGLDAPHAMVDAMAIGHTPTAGGHFPASGHVGYEGYPQATLGKKPPSPNNVDQDSKRGQEDGQWFLPTCKPRGNSVQERKLTSKMETFALLVASIFGASTIALPFAFRSCGTVFTSVLLLFVGWINHSSFMILVQCSDYVENPTYSGIITAIKSGARMWPDYAIFIKCYGLVVAYLVILGDLIPIVMENTLPFAVPSPRVVSIVVPVLFTTPIVFRRHFSGLAGVSALSVVSLLLMLVSVMAINFFVDSELVAKSNGLLTECCSALGGEAGPALVPCLRSIPIICLAFTAQQNVLPAYTSMEQRTHRAASVVIGSSVGFSLLIYGGFGFLGFLAFGGCTCEDAATNLTTHPFGMLAALAQGVVVLAGLPLQFHPARACVLRLLSGKGQTKPQVFRGVTVAMLIGAVVMSIWSEHLLVVLSLIGSLGGCMLSCLLPAAMAYFYLFKSNIKQASRSGSWVALVIFGVLVAVIAPLLAFLDWIALPPSDPSPSLDPADVYRAL